jgi:hypothetical protein
MSIRPLCLTGRLAGLLVATVVAVSATSATAGAETVGLPSGAATGGNQSAQLGSVACVSAGNCVAVGDYYDASAYSQGLIDSETNGSWTSSQVNLSGLGAGVDPVVSVTAVACPGAGNCVAVGTYDDTAGNYQGLILTQSGGAWKAAEAPIAGLNAFSDPDLRPEAISCSSVGNCVAVGSYNGMDAQDGLILTESGGSWTAGEASVTGSGGVAHPPSLLTGVTCSGSGSCVAVGDFVDSSANEQGLIETERSGSWSGAETNISGLSTASDPEVSLDALSCPSAGDCTATGLYTDDSAGNGSQQLLELSSTDYVWAAAAKVGLPGNAYADGSSGTAQQDLSADSISCPSLGSCTAVGNYDANTAGGRQALEFGETGGVWSAATEVTLPADAGADPDAQPGAVYCWAAGVCRAVGVYVTSAGILNGLVLNESNGAWSEAAAPVLSAATSDSEAAASIACTPSGYCAAAGWGWDGVGMGQPQVPFLFDAPGSIPAPSASDAYTSATVSWSAPADDGGLPLTGYSVTASDLTDTARGGQSASAAGAATSAAISGLVPGDSYSFTVTPMSLLGDGLGATSGTIAALASVTQVEQSLAKLEHPKGKGALKTIRKHGLIQSYAALEPGRVSERWYYVTRKHRRRIKTLIASAAGTATSAQTIRVEVRLNARGKRLARTHRTLRVTEILDFTPSGGAVVSVSKSLIAP